MNYFDILLAKKLRGGGGDITIKSLNVTQNGTYSEEGVTYSPVIVNVPLPENAYLLKEIEDVEIATFNDGSDLPMPKLEVAIEPVQEGSGDPSPENIRPIIGWDEVNTTVADDVDNPTVENVYTLSLGSTRYGGKVDLVSGVMTVDKASVDLGSCAWDVRSESVIRCAVSAEAKFESQYKAVNGICSAYIIVAQNSLGDGKISFNNSTQIYLQDNNHTFSTQSDAQQYLNGQKLVYELDTPLTIQLSPTVVKSLRGKNNVYADCGNILDLSYLAKEE